VLGVGGDALLSHGLRFEPPIAHFPHSHRLTRFESQVTYGNHAPMGAHVLAEHPTRRLVCLRDVRDVGQPRWADHVAGERSALHTVKQE